ncbi:Nitrogen fixation transcriptional regulator protein, NifA, partial CDS, partial [Neorhizobium galegae bv. orientalis]
QISYAVRQHGIILNEL